MANQLVNDKSNGWRINNSVPPRKLLNDDNVRRFFCLSWMRGNKPTMKQALAWVNWSLKNLGEPNLKFQKHNFIQSAIFYKSI